MKTKEYMGYGLLIVIIANTLFLKVPQFPYSLIPAFILVALTIFATYLIGKL